MAHDHLGVHANHNLGACAYRGGAAAAKAPVAMENEDARKRFGNAKSISSAQFQDDAAAGNDYENQVRGTTAAFF